LPVEDAGHRLGRVDEHHLGRAAADVEDHRRAFAMFEQDMAAQHGQPRLFLRGDDVEADARLAIDAIDEFGAVGRAPTGLRRHRAGQMDIALAQLSAQTCSAVSARSIAASDRRPDCASPSPSRTTRLNASITTKCSPAGRAISKRQLLVPRSIAA
jgi:hypothetical protein